MKLLGVSAVNPRRDRNLGHSHASRLLLRFIEHYGGSGWLGRGSDLARYEERRRRCFLARMVHLWLDFVQELFLLLLLRLRLLRLLLLLGRILLHFMIACAFTAFIRHTLTTLYISTILGGVGLFFFTEDRLLHLLPFLDHRRLPGGSSISS